jgi:hypothetical protein
MSDEHTDKQKPGTAQDDWKKSNPNQQNPNQQQKTPQSDRETFDKDQQKKQA